MEKTNRISPSEPEEAEAAANTPRSPRKNSWQDQPNKSESKESLEEYGEALKFDPDFSGPVKRRKCTGISININIFASNYFKIFLSHLYLISLQNP